MKVSTGDKGKQTSPREWGKAPSPHVSSPPFVVPSIGWSLRLEQEKRTPVPDYRAEPHSPRSPNLCPLDSISFT